MIRTKQCKINYSRVQRAMKLLLTANPTETERTDVTIVNYGLGVRSESAFHRCLRAVFPNVTQQELHKKHNLRQRRCAIE